MEISWIKIQKRTLWAPKIGTVACISQCGLKAIQVLDVCLSEPPGLRCSQGQTQGFEIVWGPLEFEQVQVLPQLKDSGEGLKPGDHGSRRSYGSLQKAFEGPVWWEGLKGGTVRVRAAGLPTCLRPLACCPPLPSAVGVCVNIVPPHMCQLFYVRLLLSCHVEFCHSCTRQNFVAFDLAPSTGQMFVTMILVPGTGRHFAACELDPRTKQNCAICFGHARECRL